jgi:hypothetical protein
MIFKMPLQNGMPVKLADMPLNLKGLLVTTLLKTF